MSSTYEPIPMRWVERIFDRMNWTYGVQKMSAMWTGLNPEHVKQTWAMALGRYQRHEIASALEAMSEQCKWPPTLHEFVELCRRKPEAVPPEHRRLLPVPDRTKEEIAAGAEQMARIRQMLRSAIKRVPTQ